MTGSDVGVARSGSGQAGEGAAQSYAMGFDEDMGMGCLIPGQHQVSSGKSGNFTFSSELFFHTSETTRATLKHPMIHPDGAGASRYLAPKLGWGEGL